MDECEVEYWWPLDAVYNVYLSVNLCLVVLDTFVLMPC